MSRFKILVFFLTLCIAGSVAAAAYWLYTNVLGRDKQIETQITQLQQDKANLPDPGIRRFDRAAELIKSGEYVEGRNAFYDLLRTFPDSNRAPEAKRIIGEINLDMMFSVETNPLKKKHIVQPGESLGAISRKYQTTIECLIRANGLYHLRLHPGDHIYVFPLDFEIVINSSKKTLTLLRADRFFKEYPIVDLRLPTTLRLPSESIVHERAAWLGNRRVDATHADFNRTDKVLVGKAGGLNIRAVPQAKPVESEVEARSLEDVTLASGVFLSREDIEELYTIIRANTVLKILR